MGGFLPKAATPQAETAADQHSAFRIPHGQRTLFLISFWDGRLPDEFCFAARPHLFPLPPGEDNAANDFWLAENCPANPVARILKETADDSRSPWGEGRDEGGREPFEI
jgi:hypothetical protein